MTEEVSNILRMLKSLIGDDEFSEQIIKELKIVIAELEESAKKS